MSDAEKPDNIAQKMRDVGMPEEDVRHFTNMNDGQKFATGMMLALAVTFESKLDHDQKMDIVALVCSMVERRGKIETIELLLKDRVNLPPHIARDTLRMLDDMATDRARLVNLTQMAFEAGRAKSVA